MFNRNEKPMGLVSDDMESKILDALKLLDDAASEKGQEIRTAVQQSFKNLHRSFSEIESGTEAAMNFVGKKGKHIREAVVNQSSKTVTDLNHKFKTKPWIFIGGFALLGVGVGYFLGHKTKGIT